ncbi:putative L-ascorbate peroxidase 4 [Platanthera guangdongensis]|uniref:L-ascorbate peroxidase 4 n=1 Tax=Platanthera guangdongensis TaxID=2320717 RepID=A0ABR2MRD8_9ASPA
MSGPVVDGEYLKEIERARTDLRALISSKNCALKMLQLALNDSCKYDKTTKTGGPNGSIRFDEVDRDGYNTQLKTAIDLLEPIKEEHRRITYADLYQLAGVVAIEVTGGPSIDFSPGRRDSSLCPKRELFRNGKPGSMTLRDILYPLGLSDKDIVVLCGVHCLAKAGVPLKFDNSYFIQLLRKDSLRILKNQNLRDKALAEDPVFRSYTELYAKDKDVFFRDYAQSHKKCSEICFVPPPISKGAKGDVGFTLLAQSVVGVAVAAAMVFLRHVYVISRKK